MPSADDFRKEYWGILQKSADDVQDLVKRAHEAGARIHFVCRDKAEYERAMRQVGNLPDFCHPLSLIFQSHMA